VPPFDAHAVIATLVQAHPLRLHESWRVVRRGAHAVVRPAGGPVAPKRVDPAGAALLEHLRRTTLLHDALPARDRVPATLERVTRMAAALVLDGVLEMRVGRRFVRGGAALADADFREHDGAAARLATAALRHGCAFASRGTPAVAETLYRYHTSPRPPWWRSRFPSRRSVAAFLHLDGPETHHVIAHAWREARGPRSRSVWRGWEARDAAPHDPRRPQPKVYVSVRPDALPDAFAITLGTLAAVPGASHVKVACTVDGPLRPDHLVAYFPDRATLRAVVPALERDLAGLPARGVPFAAALTPDGMLSWGVDPPRRPTPRDGATSWRAWLALRLAGFLTAAAACGPSPVAPHLVALARLPALGVDPHTWEPSPDLWAPAPSVA